MAFNATPTAGLRLAEGAIVANRSNNVDAIAAPTASKVCWSLQPYAAGAAIIHLALLALTVMSKFAILPAQAAGVAAVGATAQNGLLIISGTIAALLALLASKQRNADLRLANSSTMRKENLSTHEKFAPKANCQSNCESQKNWAELMARANHEFRTPLNAVIGFSDVMQRELLGPIGHDRYRDYIGHIRESGFALLKSAENTLAMTSLVADPERARHGQAHLGRMLHDAWSQLSHEAGLQSLTLDPAALHQINKRNIVVLGDEQILKQAFCNLLTDSLQQSAPQQIIRLTLKLKDHCIELGFVSHCRAGAHATNHLVSCTNDQSDNSTGLSFAMGRAMLQLLGGKVHDKRRNNEWRIAVMLETATHS